MAAPAWRWSGLFFGAATPSFADGRLPLKIGLSMYPRGAITM